MEVEEENTSNNIEESMAGESTTVINESLLENTTITDKQSENEITKSIPESKSNTPEEEDSSVSGTKSEVSKAVVMPEVEDEVVALSGGVENSIVVESVKVVDDGAVKGIDVPSDDVAPVECGGGSELTCTVDVDGGDVEEVVVDRNGDLEVVEEKVENDGDDVNVGDVSVIEKDEKEGDDVIDQFENEVDANVQLEDVENVEEMTVSDVQLKNVEGDETMTEERVVAEVVKEEGINADEEVEEEEEETVDVKEDLKEEANELTVDIVAENDEEETMVEDEEKSLDTEMEAEKSLDAEMETEKSLNDEAEAEKSLDTEMETEEEANLEDEEERVQKEEEEERVQEEEEEEEEVETEPEFPDSSKKGSGAKRKRGGKISKATQKSPAASRKTIEEDVCFICFDGGDLVLCDRRNCPKAYHPSCVNRDDAFFQSKGSWNCGWHLCSICEKKAEYMCYTCTYSLCKACTKTSVILCVREKEKKGLCEACMKTVMLIEKQEDQGNVDFDDKNSWEHLFRDYWTETKAKHNLSLDELTQAKNPWKGSGKQKNPVSQSDVKDDDNSGPDNPPENLKSRKSKRNAKKQKYAAKDESTEGSVPENAEWVSKELLEFVMHMRNGDSSAISQFEVQDLLLEYIKRNKLRDPNRKSHVICDARLENLFGKPRVAHIEMLKLLESHFLVKEDSQIDDVQGSVVDTEVSPLDDKDKKRRGRKKGDRRGPQSNREDYAAIDIHNINLIYLRRKLVEDLLDDMETFNEKIVGTFVRIRVSGVNQKQDIYRLVKVIGTSEAARYTLSKRTTCTMLEISNLDKTENVSIDTISNQDFMEDECKRLRQSIKCGFISRLTVGDVLDKAMELQAVRVNDWLETEVTRLNHLRDRASDLGRKKELRECVEKLNLLKTPEERSRRLEEIPLVHDDATMDPEYGSDADTDSDNKKQELYTRSDSFRFNKRGRDQFSPRGDYTSKESWSGTPRSSSSKNYEFSRNLSNKNFSTKLEDAATTSSFEIHNEISRDHARDTSYVQQPPIILEKPIVPDSAPKVNETEKMWHYKDPSEKIQGPFSMVQLRKWSKNGYFPVGLKIWRKSDKEDDGILLSDALEGKFPFVDQRTTSQDGQSQLRNLNPNPKPSPDSRHSIANLPSPTPYKAVTGWTGGQGGSHVGPGPGPGSGSYPSGNDGLQSPTPNSAHLAVSAAPSLVPCVNKDPGSAGPNTVPGAVAVAPQAVDQGGQQVALPTDTTMPPQMVQGWSGAVPQNLQPNMVQNIGGVQPVGYNQWTGVPNMVQNPVGNYMQVPQEQWGQFPFPVNQQQQQQQPPTQLPQPNVSWGAMVPTPNMGWVAPNPGNPMNWVPPMVQGPQVTGSVDPNWVMQGGWVPQPPVQGVVPNQNWVATPIQGQIVAGNGNPGWVGPPGTQVAPANGGWGAPGTMNTGWVGVGPVNQGGAAVANNMGWVPPTGNQGPPPPPQQSQPQPPAGITNNQNWGPRNHGGSKWGGNENRGGFSGQRRNRGGGGGSGFHVNNRRNFNNNNQEGFHKDSFHGGGSGESGGRSSDQ